jgi:hypothetical protein
MVLHYLIHPLERQQRWPGSGMPRLAASTFAVLWWIKSRPISGGWLGGITRGATEPLTQVDQLGGHCGELGAKIRILLLQSQCSTLASVDHDIQSASAMQEEGALISCRLYLTCKWESIRCQGHRQECVPKGPSRPLSANDGEATQTNCSQLRRAPFQ